MTLKVAVHGVAGRMGRAVVQILDECEDLGLAVAIDGASSPHLGRDAGELSGIGARGVAIQADLAALAQAAVVIDFSLPAAIDGLLDAVERHRTPLVLATTGLAPAQKERVAAVARAVPVVAAANYSTGVAVLAYLAERASALLPEFDLELVEMHHRHKIDAPSGTALALAEAAARGRGADLSQRAVYGRQGPIGPRARSEIGIMTLRGGDVVGDHTLILAGQGERLELSHRAGDRALFARGAVRAARWVINQPPGCYGMPDVLGL